jgi:hypothetical protein
MTYLVTFEGSFTAENGKRARKGRKVTLRNEDSVGSMMSTLERLFPGLHEPMGPKVSYRYRRVYEN